MQCSACQRDIEFRVDLDGVQYSGGNKDGLADGNGCYEINSIPHAFTYEGQLSNGKFEGEGSLKFANGTEIRGNFTQNLPNGPVEIRYFDGSTYKGDLLNGQKSGRGVFEGPNESYEGEFSENLYQGQGILKMQNFTYQGEFHKGKQHGEGSTIYNDGSSYTGQYAEGKRHGQGEFKHPNGTIYTGIFSKGLYNGYGVLIDAQNVKYEGEFLNGRKNDQDCTEYTNGEVSYKGGYKNGVKHGNCEILKLLDGRSYSGEIKYGKFEGQARLQWSDGVVYEGPFIEGRINTQGIVTLADGTQVQDYMQPKESGESIQIFPDGKKYIGEFESKRFSGKGYWDDPGVETYHGSFKNGERHGFGIQKFANGDFYEGFWQNDMYHSFGFLKTSEFTYNGLFVEGKFDPVGNLMNQDGSELIGSFKQGEPTNAIQVLPGGIFVESTQIVFFQI